MVNFLTLALKTLCASTAITAVLADYPGSYLWDPPVANEANVYARVIELKHAGSMSGKLLATWEHWYTEDAASSLPNGTEGSFIIRESSDHGDSWTTLSAVKDPQTGTGHPCARFWQPFLFEYPRPLGKYPAGTLLLVGNLVPTDKSFTQFFTWRSTDHGKTWDAVGPWQTGGTTTAGIWEPFLYLDGRGKLVAVFSDERNATTHSQMLVHVVSDDGGDTWGDVVLDVASFTQTDRPGMATVSRMSNGEYIMSYEICGRTNCPVYVKTSMDGVNWNAGDLGSPVASEDGLYYAGSSPYNIWDPSTKQVILASHNVWFTANNRLAPQTRRSVFINTKYGSGNWSWAPAPWDISNASIACNSNYSPNLLALSNGVIHYTAPSSQGATGLCAEKTGKAPVAVLPYSANFSVDFDQGWNDFGGNWSITGDEYKIAPVGNAATALSVTGSSGWTDYKISADVYISGNAGVVALTARVTQPSNGYNSFNGYMAAINTFTGNLTISQEAHNTNILGSHAHSGGIKGSTWYRLSVAVKGNHIAATLAEAQESSKTTLTVLDSSYDQGMAGLSATVGGGSFKNFHIW